MPPAPEFSSATVPSGAVVVGLDGREEDHRALEWAAAEAVSLGAPIHLISAFEFDAPRFGGVDMIGVDTLSEALGDSTGEILEKAIARLDDLAPGTSVTAYLSTGKAATALIEASTDAAEVVLGSARAGGLTRIFLGSTSTSVVALASCPVIVVGPRVPDSGQVTVALDGSEHSVAALDFAFTAAARYGCPLRALTTWFVEVVDGVVATTPGSPEYEAVQSRYVTLVEKSLKPLRERYPDVSVIVEVRRGSAAKVLLEESAGDRLLVLGTRGRGGIAGILLGSVSRKILQNATTPVAVLTAENSPR